MIFVTVGTDGPFDRLIRIVDDWARKNNRTDVFAQIGEGGTAPSFISYSRFLEPAEFRTRFNNSEMIISHAGMGTILSALTSSKPILVLPRRFDLGEQRNDHQMATARRLVSMNKIHAAFTEAELIKYLDGLESLRPLEKIGPGASPELVRTIAHFIQSA
jgi:UDP-N-acetylglucosamine transferase subunit ALG13